MARILAKALNCTSAEGPVVEPCNECDVCADIARGEDIDVVEIDGASNRGIDEIRQLRSNAIYRPARSRYKIYYIDEVHMLTTAAFNALLKTLEEPPDHVKFIFSTTDAEKIPATILSRCQRFDFHDIPTADICSHLADICKKEGVDADPDGLYRIARAAAGSMRDGLGLLDQLLAGGGGIDEEQVVRILGTPPDEKIIAVLTAIAEGDSAAALGALAQVLSSGVTLSGTAASLTTMFRNMMLCATCGGESELVELPETRRAQVAELAARFSVPVLVQAVGIFQKLWRDIRGSSVARPLLEAAVVRLAEAEKFVDPQSLIERLEQLGDGSFEKKKPAAESPGPQVSVVKSAQS
jgi:DNA polymerase-3 subunit gamma/tau